MLVRFNPTLGTTNINLRGYNFMRVITAVATAAAGSTPVVRPMTAQNTFDNSLDLITEVIANSEAGGWTVSGTNDTNGHNLPDATYTDANLYNKVYRADFYRPSYKAQYPYIKFTVTPQILHAFQSNGFMDVICGAHTDTRYNAVAGYVPIIDTNNGGYGEASVNLTGGAYNNASYSGNININYADVGSGTAAVRRDEFLLAITANYFILIQPWMGLTYFGLRTTQPWELGYDDNPPIVGWHCPTWVWKGANLMTKKTMAWWRIKDGFGQVRSQPYLSHYYTTSSSDNFVSHGQYSPEWVTNNQTSYAKISGDGFGGPLFRLKANRNGFTATGVTVGGNGFNYFPVTDPTTGVQVPPAVPINMRLGIVENTTSSQDQMWFHEGGRCLGIYKGLSGSDAFMNNYYSPGQNFIIDGENYYPYITGSDVLFRDMFLIRRY
jgi:hypothetical protein